MSRYDILLIGDGTNLLKTIGWVLEYKGFVVKTTATPEEALETLVRKNYDLVVAKLTTDDLEGLEILKRAKRLNPGVKLVVVSGNNAAIFPMEAYEVEVDDYILMPVSPTELWRRVNYCLEGREVVDLEPVRMAAEISGDGGKVGPQIMLMLHDLRGAMVSAASSLKLMGRGTYGEMSESAKVKLQEVTGRIEKMVNLSEDFIGKAMADNYSGGGAGDVLDLTTDVVEPVLAELSPEIRENHITLENRLHNHLGGIPVKGSKLWLKCIFRNLINNGIKYGGRDCNIVVDFERHGSNCRLNVYNTGKTVPETHRAMLFSYGAKERRPRKARRQGLGLGLSLSRDLMQNQGGDIWYEARNEGSNFVVNLPQI